MRIQVCPCPDPFSLFSFLHMCVFMFCCLFVNVVAERRKKISRRLLFVCSQLYWPQYFLSFCPPSYLALPIVSQCPASACCLVIPYALIAFSASVDMHTSQDCLWRWCWSSFSQKSWDSTDWLLVLSWTPKPTTRARLRSFTHCSLFPITGVIDWRQWRQRGENAGVMGGQDGRTE